MNTNDAPSSGRPLPGGPPAATRKFSSESGPRDLIIGIIAAIAAVGLLWWVASGLFGRVESRGANGVVVGKEIIPRSETEFTIGAGGLKRRDVEGEFVLRVRVPSEDRVYRVWVTETVYNQTEVGSPYFLVKPPVARAAAEEGLEGNEKSPPVGDAGGASSD